MGQNQCVCGNFRRTFIALFPIFIICSGTWRQSFGGNAVPCIISDDIWNYFFVALKSAHYYKKDERVNQVIANLFVASSGVGFVISLLIGSANVPIISELLDWIMLAVFDGNDGFERALILIFLSAILTVVWGIYYAICLRKFKESD